MGRVALLGIAHRSILVKYAQKSKSEPQLKPLAENAKTLGDWIKAHRERKNLAPYHVALKMGIAPALILAWESNVSEPDSQQRASLARALGLDADDMPVRQSLVKTQSGLLFQVR
jgi:ribosome-binding protein aMBF1 (putative translation factor)